MILRGKSSYTGETADVIGVSIGVEKPSFVLSRTIAKRIIL